MRGPSRGAMPSEGRMPAWPSPPVSRAGERARCRSCTAQIGRSTQTGPRCRSGGGTSGCPCLAPLHLQIGMGIGAFAFFMERSRLRLSPICVSVRACTLAGDGDRALRKLVALAGNETPTHSASRHRSSRSVWWMLSLRHSARGRGRSESWSEGRPRPEGGEDPSLIPAAPGRVGLTGPHRRSISPCTRPC